MRSEICVSAIGKLITLLFFAADIALGVWIYKSYRTVNTEHNYNYDSYISSEKTSSEGIGRREENKADVVSDETIIASSSVNEKNDSLSENKKAENYSTSKRPKPEEFDWYVDDVYVNGTPENADKIRDYEMLTGSWKAMIYYDITGENGSKSFDIMNMTLSGWEDESTLTVDWYRMYIENEIWDEEEWDDEIYTGSFLSGVLAVHGKGNIFLKSFYELDGKQYAVGYMDTPTGIPAVVAMVRP